MFRWIRTAKVAKGRFPQAIGWAKEVAAFAQKTFNTPEIKVFMEAFGDTGNLRWEIEYPDLATFEKVQGELMTNGDYWAAIAKANDDELFIDGTTKDYLLKEI